jgi:4-diphosphocytidyl-2-C-methyl-D-erythritol kinase
VQTPMLDKQPDVVTQAVSLSPPAKINLSLVVFARRPDGFHDLHSVMAAIDLHDDLILEPADRPGIHLFCTGLPSPAGPQNLVYRAAEMLARYAGIVPAVTIRLHKRIPSGAGLGGGSSDAAACLAGLNWLWELGLSTQELAPLAAQLGSDVAFFLHAPVAICTGRGENVEAIPLRCTRSLLLILPPVHASTALVYQHYLHNAAQTATQMERVNSFLSRGDLDGLVTQGINSLTKPCFKLFEPLRSLRAVIEGMGIGPLCLSGSGSCLFIPCSSSVQSAQWAQQIQERNLAEVKAVNFLVQTEPYPEVHHADIGSQSQTG